nr:hypothetical protein CFP56_00594 [Quercus suber]
MGQVEELIGLLIDADNGKRVKNFGRDVNGTTMAFSKRTIVNEPAMERQEVVKGNRVNVEASISRTGSEGHLLNIRLRANSCGSEEARLAKASSVCPQMGGGAPGLRAVIGGRPVTLQLLASSGPASVSPGRSCSANERLRSCSAHASGEEGLVRRGPVTPATPSGCVWRWMIWSRGSVCRCNRSRWYHRPGAGRLLLQQFLNDITCHTPTYVAYALTGSVFCLPCLACLRCPAVSAQPGCIAMSSSRAATVASAQARDRHGRRSPQILPS